MHSHAHASTGFQGVSRCVAATTDFRLSLLLAMGRGLRPHVTVSLVILSNGAAATKLGRPQLLHKLRWRGGEAGAGKRTRFVLKRISTTRRDGTSVRNAFQKENGAAALSAWKTKEQVQGLRGQRHLSAWQTKERVQGLRGRQHLSARQRKEQVQGMRGRQHLSTRQRKEQVQGVPNRRTTAETLSQRRTRKTHADRPQDSNQDQP